MDHHALTLNKLIERLIEIRDDPRRNYGDLPVVLRLKKKRSSRFLPIEGAYSGSILCPNDERAVELVSFEADEIKAPKTTTKKGE